MNGYLVASVACGLALFGFICYLVGTRRGYTLRDNELNEVARLQAQHSPTREYEAVPIRPAVPPDDLADVIAAKIAAKIAAAMTAVVPVRSDEEALRALYRLPRPVGHRGEVIEADVLEWTGRHSVAVQQGLALQRALTASTAEYNVVATTEPELWCLAGLSEPVATEDWGYPGIAVGKELERV